MHINYLNCMDTENSLLLKYKIVWYRLFSLQLFVLMTKRNYSKDNL